LAWLPAAPETERFLFALNRLRTGGLAWITRLPGAVDVLFALRAAHRLGLPGGGLGQIVRAQALLAQAQRVRQSLLDQALALAASPLSASEFGQAVESLQQQSARLLAPFDERFACLLDEVSWPDTHTTALRPARRLASPWLAHGLMMAMAAGCSGSKQVPPGPKAASAATATGRPGPRRRGGDHRAWQQQWLQLWACRCQGRRGRAPTGWNCRSVCAWRPCVQGPELASFASPQLFLRYQDAPIRPRWSFPRRTTYGGRSSRQHRPAQWTPGHSHHPRYRLCPGCLVH
jgi:hypothetical protein